MNILLLFKNEFKEPRKHFFFYPDLLSSHIMVTASHALEMQENLKKNQLSTILFPNRPD